MAKYKEEWKNLRSGLMRNLKYFHQAQNDLRRAMNAKTRTIANDAIEIAQITGQTIIRYSDDLKKLFLGNADEIGRVGKFEDLRKIAFYS